MPKQKRQQTPSDSDYAIKHKGLQCGVRMLVYWMCNELSHQKRFFAENELPDYKLTESRLEATDPNVAMRVEAGQAPPPVVAFLPITRGGDFIKLAALLTSNPNKTYRAQFKECGTFDFKMNSMPSQAYSDDKQSSPYIVGAGSYDTLLKNIESLLAEIDKNSQKAHESLFRDMKRIIKGKSADSFAGISTDKVSKAFSFVGVVAGAESFRCMGMLAAAKMAFHLAKHGKATADSLFGMNGGWPAVDKGTQEALRQIDVRAYALFAHRKRVKEFPLDAGAELVFKKFCRLTKDYTEHQFERHDPGIVSNQSLEAAARTLLTKKIISKL